MSLGVALVQQPVNAVDLVQWATKATATTEYAGYPAKNLIGPPDADGCNSPSGVWIPLLPTVTESFTVTYAKPALPKRISIYQNKFKNTISRVEVSADGLEWFEVYSGDVTAGTKGTCNSKNKYNDILSIPVLDFPTFVNRVRVTIDQSEIKNFQQIDAVSLYGTLAPTSLGIGKTMTYSAIARAADAIVPVGAAIAITSNSASCVATVKKSIVLGKTEGVCTLKIVVTPKTGSKVTKYLDVQVS